MTKKLLNTKEITELLNCHRDSLYKWRSKGMPYVKLGGAVRYDIDQVMKWFEEQEQAKQK